MRFWPESGVLLIAGAKEGDLEVAVSTSRCDVYLEPEQSEKAAAPKDTGVIITEAKAKGGVPQVK